MDPSQTFASALIQARLATVDDVSSLFGARGEDDDLARAEAHLWGAHRGVLHSPSACPTTDFLIRRSFYDQQPLSMLADDVARAADRAVPPILHAASEVAQSAGLWRPYSHAVVVSDRPSEIHLDDRFLPHREDGPAIVFRDGWSVYAWNGKAVPERWIMETSSVAPGEYRGFDPSFTAWAKSKSKPGRPVKKTRQKPGKSGGSSMRSAHPCATTRTRRTRSPWPTRRRTVSRPTSALWSIGSRPWGTRSEATVRLRACLRCPAFSVRS
jgi:hypothetical protein